MSTKKLAGRNAPIEIIDGVRILAPSGDPYFRLAWTWPDGLPGRTTARKTIEEARAKAAEIAALVQRAAGPSSATPLDEVIAEYLSTHVGRRQSKNGGDWTVPYLGQVKKQIARATHGLTDGKVCWDIDRKLVDTMRAQAGAQSTVTENTSALRGLLRWGHMEGYFSIEQAQLLPVRCPPVKPSIKGTPMPARRGRGRAVQQSERFIRDEDAPSALQVVRLGEELAKVFPAWGRLAPELAAGSGLRWGEQFQLTAFDFFLDPDDYHREGAERPFIGVDWQIDSSARVKNGDDRRKLPKGEKTRVTRAPEVSFTGFLLHDALSERREQAIWEQRNGTNPEALMFPTQTGKIFHHTSFNTDYLVPAALRSEAIWPTRIWTETREVRNRTTDRMELVTRQRTQMILTWHSLRHRFARICVDVLNMPPGELMAIGGWEDETVVKTRYYKSGKEHVDGGLSRFDLMSKAATAVSA